MGSGMEIFWGLKSNAEKLGGEWVGIRVLEMGRSVRLWH